MKGIFFRKPKQGFRMDYRQLVERNEIFAASYTIAKKSAEYYDFMQTHFDEWQYLSEFSLYRRRPIHWVNSVLRNPQVPVFIAWGEI